jgi:AraC-like DNA-binding protein
MRLPSLPMPESSTHVLPLWPPLLATRGPGAVSTPHAHHALHFILAVNGEVRARQGPNGAWMRGRGVLTAPNVTHAIDARGCEVVLVFLDPQSDLGATMADLLRGEMRLLSSGECADLHGHADPLALMRSGGREFADRAVEVLGASPLPPQLALHPRVRRVLRLLRDNRERDLRLEALACAVGLSPSRLMHVFTQSIGIPLRPYIVWLKLQRAAAMIAAGLPLAQAARSAGFADAAHMSRTFRRMLGATPSELRPRPGGT